MPDGKSVFKNREVLFPRHIPEHLPHRETHIKMLRKLFQDFLEKPGRTYERVIQIYGPVGSGKTCSVYRFGLRYEKEAKKSRIPLKYVHVSCKLEAESRFVLYQTFLDKVAPEIATRGVSASEMLRQLIKYLRSRKRFLLIALDDVDYLVRKSKEKRDEGGVIYDLTRINEMFLGEYQRVIGVIFISRDPSFRDLLEPSERSSLGNVILRLPPYTSEQLRDILLERVKDAFRPGVIEEEIVDFVADLAVGKKYDPGDCRFALDILLTSGLIADSEAAPAISIEHVRKAVSESFWGINTEDIQSLDEQRIAVLLGVVQSLRFHRTPYVSLKSVWESYLATCEMEELTPLSYSQCKDYIKDLDFRGIIDYHPDKGVSITGASIEDLSLVLQTINRRHEFED